MINPKLIDKLISAGRSPEAKLGQITKEIEDLAPYGSINTRGPDFWKTIPPDIKDDDLFAIIRAVTLAEKEYQWSGGSAAAVIWIFRKIQLRSLPLSDEVANWVLANTENYYLPFGFNNYGARSLDDYKQISAAKSERARIRDIEVKELNARAKIDREVLSQRRERSSLLRRSPERERVIHELENLPLKEQLELIAFDPLYSPNFYSPRCAASASIEVLAELSKEVRQNLLRKLKGKQKGKWGKLKKRLMAIEPLPWEERITYCIAE